MDRERIAWIVDIASVVLISVAAVLTALCGYQSGRWSGEQARFYNVANAQRAEATAASDRANVFTAIDAAVFLSYVEAFDTGDKRRALFLRRRMRAEMRPAMEAWLKTQPFTNDHAPPTPFALPEYHLKAREESRQADRRATLAFETAQLANAHADGFLLLTVVFAGVSFLAGVSTKMAYPRHLVLILLGLVGAIFGGIQLARLPFM